ncbi:MAG: hypothetical protein LQ348_003031 [Seirophora lacunosa]|nr:MAG: hypothetical protein LQ348_003031 [Seirophora lacunosa]
MNIDTIDGETSDAFEGFGSGSEEQQDKDITELELEKAVFGDQAGFYEQLKEHRNSGDNRNQPVSAQRSREDGVDDLHLIKDADSEVAWHDSDDGRVMVSLQKNPRLRKLRNYEGEDVVSGKEYTKRLRRQFQRLYPVPAWASRTRDHRHQGSNRDRIPNTSHVSSQDSSSEGEVSVEADGISVPPLSRLLQKPGAFVQAKQHVTAGKRKLRPEVIDVQRAKDVGNAQPSAITSIDFHPDHPLLLSSGPASTIFLHHISPHSPNPNPLLTSLHIHSTPLSTAAFQPPSGTKILFAGRRRYFHSWDLSSGRIDKISRLYGHQKDQKSMERFKLSACGRWMGLVGSPRKGGGVINVLDANTMQWVAEVRVESEGGVADFEWWGDGEGLTVVGKGGEAVEWDGRQKRVVGRWVDEGAVGTTVVVLGARGGGAKDLGADRWVAVGSSSGIVNIYDRKSWGGGQIPTNPKPRRMFDQLTTPTSHLAFSADGQLMVMASRWKRDALRLVHLPSCFGRYGDDLQRTIEPNEKGGASQQLSNSAWDWRVDDLPPASN